MNQQRSRRFRASKEGMEAAEEKQKIRQEILAKGKAVTIPDVVFQVRVTFFVSGVSVRDRKGMLCSPNVSVHYGVGGCSGSLFFFSPKLRSKVKCHFCFLSSCLKWVCVLLIPSGRK